jgi:PEP-CTERM motif
MSRPRIRIQVAVLVFILLPAATGVVAVHASATCERFVRSYVTKPVRNRVSKTTADAWTAWRIAHPNWKPNPNNHRPKYLMTRDEAVQKVNFACSVPLESTNLDLLFTPADFDFPPPVVDLHAMNNTQITFPDQIPPEVAEITPSEVPPLPLIPPEAPVIPGPGPVPEPGSLLLVASGIGVLGLLSEKNRRVYVQIA